MLFIRGQQAEYLRDDNIEVARAFFPNMKLVTLDAGHWVHAEKPQETGDAIVGFVEGVVVEGLKPLPKSEGGVQWL